MTNEPNDLRSMFEEASPKRSPEEEIEVLRARMDIMRDKINAAYRQDRELREDLGKRLRKIEALVQLIVLVGIMAFVGYGSVKLREYWGSGDLWGVLLVAFVALLLVVSLRDAYRA